MTEADRARWDRRHAQRSHDDPEPPRWLEELEDELPRSGAALDVAAGAGRLACWLAARGLEVTALDISPVALARCRGEAAERGLRLRTLEIDLERAPLPEGPFVLIGCLHYLQRDLFPAFRERLATGGVLVCELATRRNLERHARPPARFLIEPGELLALCAPLEIVYYREGWLDGRAQARVIARQP